MSLIHVQSLPLKRFSAPPLTGWEPKHSNGVRLFRQSVASQLSDSVSSVCSLKAVEAQEKTRQEPAKKDKEQSVTAPSKDLLGAEAQFLIPNFNLFHSINSPSPSGYNFSPQGIWCEDLLTVERAVSKAALEVEHTTARQRRNATSRSSEEARTLKKQWKQEPQLHLRIQYRKLYFRVRRRFRKECLSLRLQALASEGVQSHSRKVFPSLTI